MCMHARVCVLECVAGKSYLFEAKAFKNICKLVSFYIAPSAGSLHVVVAPVVKLVRVCECWRPGACERVLCVSAGIVLLHAIEPYFSVWFGPLQGTTKETGSQ